MMTISLGSAKLSMYFVDLNVYLSGTESFQEWMNSNWFYLQLLVLVFDP